jgi:hypothetical protein
MRVCPTPILCLPAPTPAPERPAVVTVRDGRVKIVRGTRRDR